MSRPSSSLVLSTSSALAFLPLLRGASEPRVIDVSPRSLTGAIAVSSNLTFASTASEILCLEHQNDALPTAFIRQTSSNPSMTIIAALLYRSKQGDILFCRGSKVHRRAISSSKIEMRAQVSA